MFVLHEGYAREEGDADRVGSTVTLIVDGGRVIVVDPGMVSGRDALLGALAAQGPDPAEVTDVVFSHHHPDHTVNAAMFPLRGHPRPLGQLRRATAGSAASPGTSRSPRRSGSSPHPGTRPRTSRRWRPRPDDVYACTHAWWGPDGPADDPLGTDQAALHQSRARILEVATVIIPGHGPAFRPTPNTPR